MCSIVTFLCGFAPASVGAMALFGPPVAIGLGAAEIKEVKQIPMRTEGLLWNVTHGQLDGIRLKAVVILIGVKNILQCPEEKLKWIAAGIRKGVEIVRQKTPECNLHLLGIFSTRNPAANPVRDRIALVNLLIGKLADGEKICFQDIGSKSLDAEGKIRPELIPDGVHPNAISYQVWYDVMRRFYLGCWTNNLMPNA